MDGFFFYFYLDTTFVYSLSSTLTVVIATFLLLLNIIKSECIHFLKTKLQQKKLKITETVFLNHLHHFDIFSRCSIIIKKNIWQDNLTMR